MPMSGVWNAVAHIQASNRYLDKMVLRDNFRGMYGNR